MNIFFAPKKFDLKKVPSSEKTHEVIHPYHETNLADGGEFLDDGIRMKEQPFCEIPAREDE